MVEANKALDLIEIVYWGFILLIWFIRIWLFLVSRIPYALNFLPQKNREENHSEWSEWRTYSPTSYLLNLEEDYKSTS